MSLDLRPVQVRAIALRVDGFRNFEIAEQLGLTATRVCLLLKGCGVPIPYRKFRRDYGLRSTAAWKAYRYQCRTAKARGIEWGLTFDQWWKIWQESGHWNERGRGRDRYCMARNGDVGPYSVANVYICTGSQNVKDFRGVHGERHAAALKLGHLTKALSQRGWTLITTKKCRKPYQVSLGKKYIGVFATQQEAEHAHRAAVLEKLAA